MENKFKGNINFEISTYCNAKCPTCYRTRNTKKTAFEYLKLNSRYLEILLPHLNRHMKYDDYENIVLNNLTFFKRTGAKFCGELGDPLMNPEIEKFINLNKYAFLHTTIHTNGGIRRFDWYQKMMKKNDTLVFVFGIDGVTHDINHLYRKSVNTEKAIQNMIASSKIDSERTKWAYTCFDHNQHQIEIARSLAKNYNIEFMLRQNTHEP
jgi:pyruvate-formate lyase-activating enzyme